MILPTAYEARGSMNNRKWTELSAQWLAYTFVAFVLLICTCTFLTFDSSPCHVTSTEFYLITSLLFAITLCSKLTITFVRGLYDVTSLCNIVIYVYGLITHMMLYFKPDMFLMQTHGECLPTLEFIQWMLTCPLLYLSLFTCANKKTQWASKVIIIEHISIIASAISTLAPTKYTLGAVTLSTIISLAAKGTMIKMFFPAQHVLDKQLQPFIIAVTVLYIMFPVTFALRAAQLISIRSELALFAFNDVLIKIVYAVLLEFTTYNVQVLHLTSALDIKRKDTVEKLFLRFIFHEIRNPLSVLTFAVEELAENDEQQIAVESFREGIHGLSRLLDDLKAMVELHDGNVYPEALPVNLRELISNAIIKTLPASDNNIELLCTEQLPLLIGDEYRLTQLVISTMFYCLQNRNEEQRITVKLSVIRVFDDIYCVKISFQFLTLVFSNVSSIRPEYVALRPENFGKEFALEYTFNRKLAEQICLLFNGNFEVTADGPETTVNIVLQMSRFKDAEPLVVPSIGLNLLVVDDNELQTRSLARICQSHVGFCATAANGQEAVDLARKHKFDLCFCDILMPIMNGIKAVRTIRAFDKDLVIYGISGNGFTSDFEQMKFAGAIDVLTKPVSKKEILRIIEETKNAKVKSS